MLIRKSKEKIKKMDLLITSVVLGTIVAGAFGLKKKKPLPAHEQKVSWWKKIVSSFLGK